MAIILDGQDVSHEDVMRVYKWFQQAMRRAGRKVSMPNTSDITKTYQYRWVKKFVDRIQEWKLDSTTTKQLIVNIVEYAKRNNLLSKGAGVLNMENVIEICASTLEHQIDRSNSFIGIIRRCNTQIQKVAEGDLVKPRSTGGYSNLFCLFESGVISPEYVALSKRCSRALRRIDRSERDAFPSDRELLRLRARALYNGMHEDLAKILGSDLHTAGVAGEWK